MKRQTDKEPTHDIGRAEDFERLEELEQLQGAEQEREARVPTDQQARRRRAGSDSDPAETRPEAQRAVLVGIERQRQTDFAETMAELEQLADACGVETVGQLSQKSEQPNPSSYIGSGKVEELKILLRQCEASIVVCNDELSPSHIRNLEKALQCKVIDRTLLILDIFAQRARTMEAQLQVEVARLRYMLPRLIGLRESLGRQSGGVGTKNRGAGETKLELDRRRIEGKLTALNRELETLVAGRQLQRRRRQKNGVPVVALVGYTNAGKSSLMNALLAYGDAEEHKRVLARDMLFATLETSVRSVTLHDNKTFLLTDTVGFVRQLPHHLIKAFRSTLEEVAEADLLVHVVDYANPEHERLIEVTRETLRELGADQIPVLYAFNKAELTGEPQEWPANEPDRVYVSALDGIGLDVLVERIRGHLFQAYKRCVLLIPYHQGQVVSYMNEHAHVLSTDFVEEGTRMEVECAVADYERYKDFVQMEQA